MRFVIVLLFIVHQLFLAVMRLNNYTGDERAWFVEEYLKVLDLDPEMSHL